MYENKKNSYNYDEDETYVPFNLDEIKSLSETNTDEALINKSNAIYNTGYNIYIYISIISAFLMLLSFITLFFSKVFLNYIPTNPNHDMQSIEFNFIEYFGIFNIIIYLHILVASFIIPIVVVHKSRCKGLHIVFGLLLILMFFVIVFIPSSIEKYYHSIHTQYWLRFDGITINGTFLFSIFCLIASLIMQFISFNLSIKNK